MVLFILIACVGCDQATKNIAKQSLETSPPISLLNGIIRIEYAENPGAILGLGAGLPAELRLFVAIVFAGVVLSAALNFAIKPSDLRLIQIAGLALMAAGGVGNLIDRLFNDGAVIDFISLGIGSLRTGIFNMADVAVFAGAAMFLLFSARLPRHDGDPAR
jgi:signal peptidase II